MTTKRRRRFTADFKKRVALETSAATLPPSPLQEAPVEYRRHLALCVLADDGGYAGEC